MVRFGNVLARRERDSEFPRADRARRPGYRHDPEITALFHVHPEAVQLVCRPSHGAGGEIFGARHGRARAHADLARE